MSTEQRLKIIAKNPNVTLIEMCELISFHWASNRGITVSANIIYSTHDLESIFETFAKLKGDFI